MGFAEIGGSGAVFDLETTIFRAHDAARTPRHFGDLFGAEALDDLVERALNRRQGGETLDQPITAFGRLPALDRLAVAKDRAGRDIAALIGERLE